MSEIDRFYTRLSRGILAVLGIAIGACAAKDEVYGVHIWPEHAGQEIEQFYDYSDPDSFSYSEAHGGGLALTGPASYSPPFRSPHAIALLDGHEFRNFELECDLLQTGREYGHRDLCLFFGFQAPDRFYYVHLATTPDANAHNVFLVEGAPRRNLLQPRERGVDWGQEEWHHVKLARDVDSGTIRVWFDDMNTPVLEAVDSTLEWGRVGFGSFDDTGMIRELVIRSDEVRDSPIEGSPFED